MSPHLGAGPETDTEALDVFSSPLGGTRLIDGIRQVGRGQSLMDPAVTTRILDRLRHPGAGAKSRTEIELRPCIALFGGQLVPPRRLHIIFLDA